MPSRRRRSWEHRVFLISPRYVLILDNFNFFIIRQLTVAFHFQALVRMKALQHKCVAKEGVISRLRKRNEMFTNEED